MKPVKFKVDFKAKLKAASFYKIISRVIFSVFFFSTSAQAHLCKKWSEPQKIGKLDVAIIPEASGIAQSYLFKNRIYHNNDSGDGPFFYITNLYGENTQKIEVSNFNPIDLEELAVGPCNKKNMCLFLADIGDNQEKRSFVEIVLLKEEEKYNQPVIPLNKVIATYPDRPHNAEAMFVHPKDGDLYVITKEFSKQNMRAESAIVFRLSQKELMSNKPVIFEKMGEINLPWINNEYDAFGQIVTGASISSNGKKFILLTYENAIEFNLKIDKMKILDIHQLRRNHDFQVIPLLQIAPQQEAISFLPKTRDFIFSSESATSEEASIFKVQCLGTVK